MTRHPLACGLAALLLLSTLFEGGASPEGLLVTHAAVAALLTAALALPRGRDEERWALPVGVGAALGGFAFLALLGAALAPYRYAALLVLQEIGAFAAIAFLAARTGRSLPGALSLPLLSGGAALGTWAVAQRLSGDLRPAASFLNPSHLAAWLVAVLLVGVVAPGAWRSPRGAAARGALALPIVVALVLTGSRGALLGLAAGGAWLLPRLVRRIEGRRRLLLAGIAGAVVVAMGIGVAHRFERDDPFRYHRLKIWRASAEAVVESPWLGTGPGQFQAAAANLNFPIDRGPLRYAKRFRSTHSDLLRLFAEFGLPAAGVALLGLWLAWRRARGALRSAPHPAEIAGAMAALVAIATQALVENLGERPAIHLLAAALLGAAASEPRAAGRRAGRVVRAAAAVLLAVAFAVGDAATYAAWKAARRLPRGALDAEQERRLSLALSANPRHPDLWLRRAEALSGDGRSWDAAGYAAAREAAEKAVRLQPADARYRRGIARVEALACVTLFRDEGTRERAARQFDAASDLARHDPFLPIEKGRFLLEAGDPEGARRAAEQALRIEPEAVPAKVLLAEAVLAAGGPGAARAAEARFREAERTARRWADYPKGSAYEIRLLTLGTRGAEPPREPGPSPGSQP